MKIEVETFAAHESPKQILPVLACDFLEFMPFVESMASTSSVKDLRPESDAENGSHFPK